MSERIQEISNWYDVNKDVYERFSKEISNIIEKILKKNNIPFHSISYRTKEKGSFLTKSQKEKYSNPMEEILDIAGIRIIAYTNQDVIKICEVIKNQFLVDADNSGDKAEILSEDRVGYLSVHFIVQLSKNRADLPEYEEFKDLKGEIQVRTLLQHAWAEIEHDKNYKFSGVLPKDIKRRFHLVAGVLEMMDKEFDSLSRDIDEYVQEIKEKTKEEDFNVDIDSTTLKEYLLYKRSKKDIEFEDKGEVNYKVIDELKKFGFNKIKDIEKCLSNTEVEIRDTSSAGLLRDLMIISDAKKYFEDSFQGYWGGYTDEDLSFWVESGVQNIEMYLRHHDIRRIVE